MLYALLVGINHYHPDSRVPTLNGCANDLQAARQFLEAHFPKDRIVIEELRDHDATYQNVVDRWGPAFLQKAGKDDVVLFLYSGHGARERSDRAFLPYFPEGMNESLVCYDSRLPGRFDLADKELGVLVQRVAQNGPHVALWLDCCHSGSATKAVGDFRLGAVRQWDIRQEERPLDSYLEGYFSKKGVHIPESRHISLGACDRTEKAFELLTNRGNFSAHLLQVLDQYGPAISYARLFTECRNAMLRLSGEQHPQFEPSGYFNAFSGFLGWPVEGEGRPTRVFFQEGKWQVNSGAINGLPTTADQSAQFVVLRDGKEIGHARTTVTGLDQSEVKIDFLGNSDLQYEARMTSVPSPPMEFLLKTDNAGNDRLQQALSAYQPVHFHLNPQAEEAAYRLEVKATQVSLYDHRTGEQLRTLLGNDEGQIFADAFDKLEKLAQYEKNLRLDNPGTRIRREEIQLVLEELDANGSVARRHTEEEAIIDIFREGGQERTVPFRLLVQNDSARERRVVLLYFSPQYGIHSVRSEPIAARSSAILMEHDQRGNRYQFELRGKAESLDLFKILVTNRPIQDQLLAQEGFRPGETKEYQRSKSVADRGGLGQARFINDFYLDAEDAGPEESESDWFSRSIAVRCVAREARVGAKAVTLAGGSIVVKAHSGFQADLGLSAATPNSRDLSVMSVITQLAEQEGAEMLQFGRASRSLFGAPNVLEITGYSGEETLADDPLTIELEAGLQAGESLLPLTFDGQHILPVGEVERLTDGKARVSIRQLPENGGRSRSLTKALKLAFLKLVLRQDRPQYLRWVDYGQAKVQRQDQGVAAKVKAAKNILLVIHGIIGDTQPMAECVAPLQQSGHYDLVLTFDYENLNTPIGDTAAALGERLREAGIGTGDGKRLSILAHSMGGLVARYYIENLNGKEVVDRLLMAGTPNAGSAIAQLTKYRDYAKILLGFALNFGWGFPAAATIFGILDRSSAVTATLEQMDVKNNSFLEKLNQSADPGIPYGIVAGNLGQFLERKPDARSLLDKLYRLGGKVFYGQEPNDLAVSMDSIKAVPAGRQPATQVRDLAAHHLNYFSEPVSVEALLEML